MTTQELRITATLRRIQDGENITERELRSLDKALYRLRNHCHPDDENDPTSQNRILLRRVKVAIAAVTKPCPGEAHSNVLIDTCMCCTPRWGIVPNERVVG